jgi:hypothetical protein
MTAPRTAAGRCEEIVANADDRCTRRAVVGICYDGSANWLYYCRQHANSIAAMTTRRLSARELDGSPGWTA